MEAAKNTQRTICKADKVGEDRAAISAIVGVSNSGGARRTPAEARKDAARRRAVGRRG